MTFVIDAPSIYFLYNMMSDLVRLRERTPR